MDSDDSFVQKTTNLGVGSSNLPQCANKINDLTLNIQIKLDH